MGRAAAIAFAREGADVAINYLPSEEPDASEVVELIRAAGRKAVPIPGDLRDASFCRRLVEDAVRQLGGLDILVSNAGRQQSRPSIAEVSDEDFDATMKTNIYAPFYIIKAALPHLQPGSAIIATASEQAYDPSPDLYDYAQTKAATMNFVKSLAKQLGPKGIRVNGVAPGPIWTPLQISGGASEGKVVTFGATAPLGRAGQPAELAGIYVRLAEDDGSYTRATSMAPAAVKASLSMRTLADGPTRIKGRIEMLKTRLWGAIALAVIVGGHGAQAQTPIPPSPKDFVMAASQSNQYEILAARVASVQSQDPRVRTFAQDDDPGAHSSLPRPTQCGRGLGIAGA